MQWEEVESLQDVAADVEVLYQTRIQKYIINKEVMQRLPKDSVVMHPLPRVDEVRCHSEVR